MKQHIVGHEAASASCRRRNLTVKDCPVTRVPNLRVLPNVCVLCNDYADVSPQSQGTYMLAGVLVQCKAAAAGEQLLVIWLDRQQLGGGGG